MALSCAAPVVELDAVSPIRSRTVVVTSTMLNWRIHPRRELGSVHRGCFRSEAARDPRSWSLRALLHGLRSSPPAAVLGRFVKGVDSKSHTSTEPLSNATRASGNRNVALGSKNLPLVPACPGRPGHISRIDKGR
jgi:hypothetical protein